MANNWHDEVFELLRPHMMCSVTERYQFFLNTEFGRSCINILNLQGSLMEVRISVIDVLKRFGTHEIFIREFKKIPVPKWYKEIKK